MTAPRVSTIEGRQTLVTANTSTLPRALQDLLAQMSPYGFAFKQDIALSGARPACEVLRTHRFRRFREGRWFNPRAFSVAIGSYPGADGPVIQTATVPRGLLALNLQMCADCGAVAVRDVSPTPADPRARPATLYNRQTGETRIAPAVGRRDLVIGWYSGKRRAGREFR